MKNVRDVEKKICLLCDNYLNALTHADMATIEEIFLPDATIISPLYGEMHFLDFYRHLFSKTSGSRLTPLDTFVSVSSHRVALYFQYDWTLQNGAHDKFDCVDVFDIDLSDMRFSKMTIIYDTSRIRDAATEN